MTIISDKHNRVMNLLQLQNDLNDIVFNYIDTSQNWEKAYSYLDELMNVAIEHFQTSNLDEQKTLAANTYWVIYLNTISRLIYFHTIAYKEMKANSSELSLENVLMLLTLAAKCLPNTKYEENREFLDELKQTVAQLGGSVEEIEKIAQKNNENPTSCINAFQEYCKLYS